MLLAHWMYWTAALLAIPDMMSEPDGDKGDDKQHSEELTRQDTVRKWANSIMQSPVKKANKMSTLELAAGQARAPPGRASAAAKTTKREATGDSCSQRFPSVTSYSSGSSGIDFQVE
jgi:hypothetical protein